jgi:hypothetical protein
MQEKKNYLGRGYRKEINGAEFTNVSLDLEKINQLPYTTWTDGKGKVRKQVYISISKLQNVEPGKETHTVYEDTYRTQNKQENKSENNPF